MKVLLGVFACLLSISSIGQIVNPEHSSSVKYKGPYSQNYAVALSGNYAYMLGNEGLQVIDVANPAAPVITGVVSAMEDWAPVFGRALTVSGNYLYAVCAGVDHALLVLDVSNPSRPYLVSRLLNGVGGARLHDPNSIAVSGNYAYISSRLSNALEVVDISDAANPRHHTSLSVGWGGAAISSPRSLALSGNYVYMTCENRNMEVIDISNPSAPVSIAKYTFPSAPLKIHVDGNYAYVGCLGTSTLQGRWHILDITNPSSPTWKSKLDAEGIVPTGICVSGSYAYMVSTSNVVGGQKDWSKMFLEVIDVANPTTPVKTASLPMSDPQGVAVSGDNVFVAEWGQAGLTIVNVRNKTVPQRRHITWPYTRLNGPNSVVSYGNFAYVASNSGLQAFDVSDPANPVAVPMICCTFPIAGIALSGDLLVLADQSFGIVLLDLADPARPAWLSDYNNGSRYRRPSAVFLKGNYVYMTDEEVNSLSVIDISDRLHPVHAGSIVDGSGGARLLDPTSIVVSGNYAYIISERSVLEIIDISVPSVPTHRGSLVHGSGGALLLGATSIAIDGNHAYVASSTSDALEIIDISNPAAPVHRASITHNANGPLLDGANAVSVSGNYAFVGSAQSDALEIIDIINPAVPVHKGSLRNSVRDGICLAYVNSISVAGDHAYLASAANNALEIVRFAPPRVTGLSPSSGMVCSTITITGERFDPIPGNNRVEFNGIPAMVISSTVTTITATVPSGATTGTVTVTTGGGSSTSRMLFGVIDGRITSRNNGVYGESIALSTTLPACDPASITYSVVNGTGSATVNGHVLTLTGAGYVTLNATVRGTPGYPETTMSQRIEIDQAVLYATANYSRQYGTENPAVFPIQYSGFVNGDDASALAEAPEVYTSADACNDVGEYLLAVVGGYSPNYYIRSSSGRLTVTKREITASADPITRRYGEANPPLTVSYNSLVCGDRKEMLDIPPSPGTTATSASDAGTYPIVLSSASDRNYSISTIDGTLTILKADPIINFPPIATDCPGTTTSLNVSSNVNLPISYASSDETIARVSADGIMTRVSSGSATITATQTGNGNYNTVSKSQSVSVRTAPSFSEIKYDGTTVAPLDCSVAFAYTPSVTHRLYAVSSSGRTEFSVSPSSNITYTSNSTTFTWIVRSTTPTYSVSMKVSDGYCITTECMYFSNNAGGARLNVSGVDFEERETHREKITAYPNPSKDYVTVSLAESATRDTPVLVYDRFGRLVLEKSIVPGSSDTIIPVSDLSDGLYILKVNRASYGADVIKLTVAR